MKDKLLPQIGVSVTADFSENNWTFKMPINYYVAAGRFLITPIPKHFRPKPIKAKGQSFVETKRIRKEITDHFNKDFPCSSFRAIKQDEVE